jgi:hypothetical protein
MNMLRESRIGRTGLLVLLLAAPAGCAENPTDLLPTSPLLSNSGNPLVVEWTKSLDLIESDLPDLVVWTGTVTGDVSGDLRVTFLGFEERGGGANWYVTLRWEVADPTDGPAFSADLSGTLNWQSGAVRLNGYVDSGELAGARVVHRGQLGQDAEGNYTAFEAPATGTIRFIP